MSAALWPLRSPLVCYHFASDIVRSWWFVRGLARIGSERGFLLCVGASVRAHMVMRVRVYILEVRLPSCVPE